MHKAVTPEDVKAAFAQGLEVSFFITGLLALKVELTPSYISIRSLRSGRCDVLGTTLTFNRTLQHASERGNHHLAKQRS